MQLYCQKTFILSFLWKDPTSSFKKNKKTNNIFRNSEGEKGLENELEGAKWKEIHPWVARSVKNPTIQTPQNIRDLTSMVYEEQFIQQKGNCSEGRKWIEI